MKLSLERQRRSSFDWAELVPPDVARGQIAWERARTALALIEAGYSIVEVGMLYGVTYNRVQQLLDRARRISPVALYQAEEPDPVRGKLRRDVIRALANRRSTF